jgi:hypothetical protein
VGASVGEGSVVGVLDGSAVAVGTREVLVGAIVSVGAGVSGTALGDDATPQPAIKAASTSRHAMRMSFTRLVALGDWLFSGSKAMIILLEIPSLCPKSRRSGAVPATWQTRVFFVEFHDISQNVLGSTQISYASPDFTRKAQQMQRSCVCQCLSRAANGYQLFGAYQGTRLPWPMPDVPVAAPSTLERDLHFWQRPV